MAPTKIQAMGRWHEILRSLGIDGQYLRNFHGPCPICGGRDRFRFDDKGSGKYFCNGCGHGDGFDLLAKVNGWSVKETFARVNKFLGIDPSLPSKDKDTHQQKTAMNALWRAAGSPSARGPLHTYLGKRLGRPWASNSILREARGIKHPTDGERYDAMIAKITDSLGNPVNIHITYLKDGAKANVSPAKRVMAGQLPEGSAIRLMDPAPIMGIAEGIETAMSASLIFNIPVWAAINGALLAKWVAPEIAQTIIIFGDNDANFAGQAKAYALANRIATVQKLGVEVKIPELVGDWNDVLISR